MLRLAREVMEAGRAAPAIYNAADEIAVAAFLEERIPFLGIPRLVEQTLQTVPICDPASLDEVVALDAETRRVATQFLNTR